MDPVRIGLIGAGFWTAASHIPAIRKCPRVVLRAVCRRDKAKLLAAQKAFGCEEAYTDWKEMISKSDLDAVIVCTPHDTHAEPSIAALRQGLHVLVEKPMAITGKDARAMEEAAASSGRVLMSTYNDRFSGKWRTAKKILESGRIGPVRQVNLAYTWFRRFYWEEKRIPEPVWKSGNRLLESAKLPEGYFGDGDLSGDWRSDAARNGGGTFNNPGAHRAHLALWLAGSQPVEVSAFTAPEGREPEYFISVLARLADGGQLTVCFGDAVPEKDQMRLTVIGDLGMMAYDHADGEIRVTAGGKTETLASELPDVTPVEAFAASILDGSPNLSPPSDSVQSVLLTEAAYRSARTHAVVSVDGAGQGGDGNAPYAGD
jgi:predicted dehydrogenase